RRVEVDGAVLLGGEGAVLQSLGEHLALLGDPGLEPERDPDALLAKLRDGAGRVREPLLVPDQVRAQPPAQPARIEVDDVERYPLLAGLPHDLPDLVPAPVARLGLPEPERPARRHWRPAGQPGVPREDVRDARAVDEEQVQAVVLGLDL